ncbi:MAG: TraU family protein [Rickettsiaceae bacterium]|nr:TraU family protein [Rickettsiaceae bacterium]
MKFTCFVIILLLNGNVSAKCTGRITNPITDVCWSCLFPLSIGSAKVAKIASGMNPDTENPSSPICVCPTATPIPRVGVAIGYWEPAALVDVTRTPYCLVNLGGIKPNLGASYKMGSVTSNGGNGNTSFYDVHWYKFPLMLWLNILTDVACMQGGQLDIGYLSELDPTWHDDELAFITNPEAILFGNPIAQASCAADAVAASVGLLPLSPLFWCAGSQGSMYPLSGAVQNHVGGAQASTLLTQRVTFKMHRLLLLKDSFGVNGPMLCSETTTPIMPKHRYRYQMVYPVASTSKLTGCKPFGASTALWEAGHEYPVKGEDFGYLVWKKRNCCAL